MKSEFIFQRRYNAILLRKFDVPTLALAEPSLPAFFADVVVNLRDLGRSLRLIEFDGLGVGMTLNEFYLVY